MYIFFLSVEFNFAACRLPPVLIITAHPPLFTSAFSFSSQHAQKHDLSTFHWRAGSLFFLFFIFPLIHYIFNLLLSSAAAFGVKDYRGQIVNAGGLELQRESRGFNFA